jgi:hypothetical protein
VGTELRNIPALYDALRIRWEQRDERIATMDLVLKGEWSAVDPDDDEIETRSPNMIQVALEDTAEAASILPTVRVQPSSAKEMAKKKQVAMEQLAMSYLDVSQVARLTIKSLQDLAAFGMFSWCIVYDRESKSPVIQWRDPRTALPEFGWQSMDSVRTCMFHRVLYVRQLPPEWREKVEAAYGEHWTRDQNFASVPFLDRKVTIVELFEQDEITIAALWSESTLGPYSKKSSWIPVELERTPTIGGICPVIIETRITSDNEPRGQFDQVVGVMQAHIRLIGMVLDYSDQAVYSDVWVKDLVGQMSYGGGAYIQLGPQGAIGRVPPAVTSLTVHQELQQLVDAIHLGGRWPKSRPGEIDQAIASAKFIEATAGMMNTVIRTYHLLMKAAYEKALRVCFKVDSEKGPLRTVSGILKNQQFLSERSRDDIDLGAKVHVEYGIALGRDQAQAMVLGIQGMQTGLWSRDFVQEQFDGITDVDRERRRLDIQQLKDMAMAQILQGLQGGTIPQQALVQIAKARDEGDDIFDLFDKYIVKPQAEQEASMLTSGLTGERLMPGSGPPAGGPMPPAPPDGAGLLAALAGGGGGGAPPESISRLSTPAGGPGSFAGVTSRA